MLSDVQHVLYEESESEAGEAWTTAESSPAAVGIPSSFSGLLLLMARWVFAVWKNVNQHGAAWKDAAIVYRLLDDRRYCSFVLVPDMCCCCCCCNILTVHTSSVEWPEKWPHPDNVALRELRFFEQILRGYKHEPYYNKISPTRAHACITTGSLQWIATVAS